MPYHVMGRSARLIAVLLPLGAFVLAVLHVRGLMDAGERFASIVWLVGALVVLALVEGLLFKCWILPPIARELGERVYAGGTYSPAEDALLVLVERIRQEADRTLLPELERLVLADARRTRGWQEYARLLQDVFGDAPAALGTLRRGAEQVADKDDRAMLLCRAAYLASAALHDAALAEELYREAAGRYPRTAYGRFAAERLAPPGREV